MKFLLKCQPLCPIPICRSFFVIHFCANIYDLCCYTFTKSMVLTHLAASVGDLNSGSAPPSASGRVAPKWSAEASTLQMASSAPWQG